MSRWHELRGLSVGGKSSTKPPSTVRSATPKLAWRLRVGTVWNHVKVENGCLPTCLSACLFGGPSHVPPFSSVFCTAMLAAPSRTPAWHLPAALVIVAGGVHRRSPAAQQEQYCSMSSTIGVHARNSLLAKRGADRVRCDAMRHRALTRFRSWYGLNLPQASHLQHTVS